MPVKVCDGNKAAAYAVQLAKPDVIAMYPITPQTPLVEQIARFKSQGQLEAELIEVEGENTSLSAVMAASVAGARCFTATSSWGLAYMYDALIFCAGHRVPLVMVNVNRESPSVRSVANGRSDVMSVTEAGWIQIEAENCQEILDLVLISYRLAEDPAIMLPVMICYDGFYLSHLSETVVIPEQEKADLFVSPRPNPNRVRLTPGAPLNFGATVAERPFIEYKHKNVAAMQKVNERLQALEKEFAGVVGRAYPGPVEAYRMEDAELVLVAAGSSAGTAKDVVDQERALGNPVGLLRIRVLQPFPAEIMRKLLKGRKAVAVVDRSVHMGWGCGHLFGETKMALYGSEPVKIYSFIDGLANTDITLDNLKGVIELTRQAAEGREIPEVNWVGLD